MLEVVNPAGYFFNPYAVPPAIVATLIFAVGLFVYLQNRRFRTNISFFLICLCLSLWLYGISIVYCSGNPDLALFWYRWATFLGVVHISPIIYTFSVVWLGLYERQKHFVRGSFILALIFYILAVSTPYGMPSVRRYFWGYYPSYGIAGRVFLFFFFGYFLAAFYNFFSQLRVETVPLKRKQIKLITIAFLISITGSVDYLPKLVILSFYPFGFLSVFVWVLIVAYLIVRYRVMDIQTVIHKTIMWALTSFVFAIPVVFLSYIGKGWLAEQDSTTFSGIVFALTLLFILYARSIQPKIDHLFQRRQWDLARAFEKFTDELVHLRGLDELSSHITDTIKQILYVQEFSILFSKDENGPFEFVKASSPTQKISFLPRTSPFLTWLEQNDLLILQEYVDLDSRYVPIQKEAKEYFRQVGAQLCVPLVANRHLLGLINLGQKANLKSYNASEINFLSDLRKTAAIALSNSLRSIAMQESLRRWNVELEKKVEERTKELKETQSQLIQAEKLASIGTLAGGIAHEINNPLTAVLTNVQMLKMIGEVPDPESLSLIEEGAKRCQVIIQKLMRYARKTGEVENYQEVDLNQVIRNVFDFLGYQLNQENIEIVLKLGALGPMMGIANELEQVFTNLVLNSRDAIKAAGRRGRIEIKTEQKDGGVKIEFSDNGTGIKKQHLARIFDPFYTTKDVGEGTGLGLTVTSGIVEKHFGKISVSSEEGGGTTFHIQFPNAKGKTASVTS